MRRNVITNRFRVLIAVVLLLLMAGCGVSDPSSIIGEGAEQFADGKSEIDGGLISSEKLLLKLMDDFSGSFGQPDSNQIDEDDAQQIVDDADEEDVVEVDNDIVASDDDLKEILHQMLDDTKTVATFEIDPSYSFDGDTILELYDELTYEDAYDVFGVETFSWTDTGKERTISFTYDTSVSELKSMKSEERTLVGKAVKDIENMIDVSSSSDYEIICAVNDYLCDLITYPPLDVNKYPPIGAKPVWHTAWSGLKNGDAVCDGYSRCAKLLLNEFGIECGIEVGECTNGGGHAWNIVKVDGSWYQMDVTWNDGAGDYDPSGRTEYLLVTDDFMKQSRTWDYGDYPATPSKPYK